MSQMPVVVERRAVRALILTPEREILLFRLRPPEGDCFWIAPGGGLDGGETVEGALRRELLEELGIDGFAIGPLVWRRHHTFDWAGRRISQRELYHIVEMPRFTPVMADETEAQWIDCHRWWPIADLAGAGEALTPLSLAAIVARYLAEGAPAALPPEEVLVD